jgi:hypothetical protein
MMKIPKIIFVLALSALALAPIGGTGFIYNPMTPGYSLKYNTWIMTGRYDPNDGYIYPVTLTNSHKDNTLTYGTSECAALGSQSLYTFQYHPTADEAGSGVNLSNMFAIAPNGTRYIGEVGLDMLVLPPEPIYIVDPTPNQVLDVYSKVYRGCDDFTVIHNSFHSRIQYVGAGKWNQYKTQVFSLREYATEVGSPPDKVYTYIYCEGIGLCQLQFGDLNPVTNIVTGVLAYFLP